MTQPTARLPADSANVFSGQWIDRTKPVRFRLNGRAYSGYSGDTIYTALIASGVTSLGLHLRSPVGLRANALPWIYPAAHFKDPETALPMARTPITPGADYVTTAQNAASGLKRLFQGSHTLGLALDQMRQTQPWQYASASEKLETEVIVVGGGVAGMATALAASRRNLSVIVIEAEQALRGHSGLFGSQEGEDGAEASMVRLAQAVNADAKITVLTRSHAFAIGQHVVRVHAIEIRDGVVSSKIIDIAAPNIVIATGVTERLPLFSGNRLPGVMGSLEAYELATRFGLWPGETALFATGTNTSYHLAVKAREAGISVKRILDARADPASRYIEFSRAYGLVQVPGSSIEYASITGSNLHIHFNSANHEPLTTSRLILAGGWQANLDLWHMAGGQSQWNTQHLTLEAIGQLEGIALAGSAAGYQTRTACIHSGADAIDELLGKARKPVRDVLIAPIYETPDAQISVANNVFAAPTYLDASTSYLTRPKSSRTTSTHLPALAEIPHYLTINEITAAACLDWVPAEAVSSVVAERTPSPPLVPNQDAASPVEHHGVPSYLAGRYGDNARVVKLCVADQRRVSSGSMIFRNSDCREPEKAIGVVLRHGPEGALALMAAQALQAALPVSIRDQGSIIAARIEEFNN